jgi:CRISPR-associated protein (TIGR02584 family)
MRAGPGRSVLWAVCGRTPQVITETLYALQLQGRQVEAVRVLTTASGKAECNARLFDPEQGHYYQFLRDFDIPRNGMDFGPRHVHAVADSHGRPIEDITGEEDNELFLRACMEHAFALTSDPGRAVYFSIAGGRKTMGACLALAAQFYGRPQDRLFHVLVSPEFENCPEFFYPPPQSRAVTLRDQMGQPFQKETRYARVTLVHLPFVSVRERLSESMLTTPESPEALLLSTVREERPTLVIDLQERKVCWKGVESDLSPAHLALYAFFAMTKKRSDCGLESCSQCQECFPTVAEVLDRSEELARLYQQGIPRERVIEAMSDTGILSLNQENFHSFRGKINKRLEKAFGPYDAGDLQIASTGTRPGTRYGILLERKQIQLRL